MESSAAFLERGAQFGISSSLLKKLQDKNLSTFGQFAFISSFQPGSSDEKPFVRALAAALDVDESAIESGVLAAFRRLYFESHTLTLGDLRARMERRDDDQPRKLPMAERAERLAQLKAQLTGVTIDVQLEPAHRLVDAVNQQIEDNCVKYVPIKDCLSRESELMHQKHETAIDFLPDGTMKLSKKQKEIHADTTGELKVKMAMQRRALAYHMAGACSYNVLDGIISRMFALLTKEPTAGMRSITLQQIIHADRELWMQAAQSTRGKILGSAGRPLEDELQKLQDSPEVRYHLLPTQSQGVKRNQDDESEVPVKKGKKFKKGKGKEGKGSFKLPENCVPMTPSKQRICFQYNRKRCNHQDAAQCSRGLHVCWKDKCHGKHPGDDCKA